VFKTPTLQEVNVSKKITFLDKTFWITESEANPKHVAGLQILQKPANAPVDYVEQLYKQLLSFNYTSAPFDCRVKQFLGFPVKLVPVAQLDMSYHVQLHKIANIDDKAALHKFIAGLHETWLDRDKPLWQYHLISATDSDKFAIYIKVHHMYGDGATLIRWFQVGYTPEPRSEGFVPVWAAQRKPRQTKPVNVFKQLFIGCWDFLITVKDLIWILFRLFLKLLRINQVYMPIPFSGTKTLLTGQVKKGRLVSTLSIDFRRIKALSHRLRCSANELMLCVFDIGVHRFLKDYGHVFKRALYTNMPINLRKPGETTAGNKIAIVPVQLAHGETDPYLRLRQIIENHRIVKRAATVSHPMAFSYYTVLIQSFSTLFEILQISNWVKPIANILVSNMPGPAETLYFKDSKLLANFPVSTMTPGGGVNITMVSYAGNANIGLVCCDNNIESLEPMSQYFLEAFDMLEACVDDPSQNIDDIGETVVEDASSIVDEDNFTQIDEKQS
jgi:diacylglycerol O-acyltransferase / wax synthase